MGLSSELKNIVPLALRRLSRRVKADLASQGNRHLTAQEVFTKVYAKGAWGGEPGTFFSGPGSSEQAARPYADFVVRFMQRRGLRAIVDLGCGDFRVGQLISASGLDYTGVDVVEQLVSDNARRHAAPNVQFVCADITRDPLPDGDVCLIREVFQHLSNAQVSATLAKLSRYRHALITEVHPEDLAHYTINRDKPHGATSRLAHFSLLRLDAPPFNLTNTRLVFEAEAPYFASYAVYGHGFKLRTFLISRELHGKPDD